MYRLMIKLIGALLTAAVCISLLGSCVTGDRTPTEPSQDPTDNNPTLIDPETQGGEKPDDTPLLPPDEEEEPQSPPTEDIPPEVILPEEPGEEVTDPEDPNEEPPSEEVIENPLPRDIYDLPYPLISLSEEEAKLCLAPTEELGHDYFADSVFLGDSVTLGLRNYATKKRKTNPDFLSNAAFIGVGSYSVYEALLTPSETTIHALYNGVQTQPQDILADMGAEKVFICLGLNDVGLFTVNQHLTHYATLILRIQTACPGIKIVIISTTPLTVEGEKKALYNYRIDTFNREVIKLAEQYNCYYADVTSVLKDEEGYLADELSSDNYCHLENEAYDKIIHYLLTHATPDAVESESDNRESVLLPPAEVEGYEGDMGEG